MYPPAYIDKSIILAYNRVKFKFVLYWNIYIIVFVYINKRKDMKLTVLQINKNKIFLHVYYAEI